MPDTSRYFRDAGATSPADVPRAVRLTAWIVITAIAALQAYVYRDRMNPDGLSYLDSARAFAAGDIAVGLNPHWGPLYSATIGAWMAFFEPAVTSIIPIAHLISFLFFLVAFAAFEWLLRELLRGRQHATSAAIFAYAVFGYGTLILTGFRLVTPDFAVMASAFGAAAVILRMQRGGATAGQAVLLGAMLAIGYYAKSVMFVLGVAFIGSLIFLPTGDRRPWRAIMIAFAVFVAMSSVLIVPFSRKTGSFTFGTAGKLAYNWEVNFIPYTNWQGDAKSKLPHPPRQLHASPDLFEYTQHLQGTYPPWFDPAYWNTGTVVTFRPWKQILQLHRSTQFYGDLFLGSALAIATLVALLALGRHLGSYLAVLLPALAGLGIYWPVHLEPRYIAPFATLLLIIPVALRRSTSPERMRLIDRAAAVAAVLLILRVGLVMLSDLWKRHDDPNPFTKVAAALQQRGIAPGDRVANVGGVLGENYGASFEGYWAYLAGVQIVAEVPEQRGFICEPPAVTDTIYAKMAAVGARAVVTRGIPLESCAAGWQRVDGTDYYLRMLTPAPATATTGELTATESSANPK